MRGLAFAYESSQHICYNKRTSAAAQRQTDCSCLYAGSWTLVVNNAEDRGSQVTLIVLYVGALLPCVYCSLKMIQ